MSYRDEGASQKAALERAAAEADAERLDLADRRAFVRKHSDRIPWPRCSAAGWWCSRWAVRSWDARCS